MIDSRLTALKTAMQLEKDGMDYYQAAQDKAISKTGRNMFEYLRRSEEGHLKRIGLIYHTLMQSNGWPNHNPHVALPESVPQSIFTQAKEELKQTALLNTDDIEALQQAIKFETKGVGYYTECAEAAVDSFEKEFFTQLAHEERSHLTAIQDTIMMLENPQGFFADREHGIMSE